ncbi:MAG: phosphoserine transaminase [Alphaproteobacteria bacterium]|nr:phosphoserine transaminase [Alphaproteobacteria bacterium]
MEKPAVKPRNPCFSSGPCAKRPGWSLDALSGALLGRSHRAAPLKKQLKDVIDRHRQILGIPEDYLIGIVPASDTGAFEMALWSMLGARGVDVFAWEAFSGDWLKDVTGELKIEDVKTYKAPYGALPDLSAADPARDCVFAWNGTTSGVRVPDGDWLSEAREGLTFCDATSAVFAYDLPWEKLDVVTWSWQKVLGGEAAHGMLVLSPRAVERLERFVPDRPLPKIFRMTKKGKDGAVKVNRDLFEGATINTPSMLAVADCLDALNWVSNIGGLRTTIARSEENFKAIENWVNKTPWVDFLAEDPASRSTTSVCLKIIDQEFAALDDGAQQGFIKAMTKALQDEKVAYDIAAYRDAPAGLRIWCGATVQPGDVEHLMPWLDWAFMVAKMSARAAA